MCFSNTGFINFNNDSRNDLDGMDDLDGLGLGGLMPNPNINNQLSFKS